MKIFFVNSQLSNLADNESKMLNKVKESLLKFETVKEVTSPDLADALLIEEKTSFKNFRYIDLLLKDPLISNYSHKTFTINRDDCATGLLRGLYTSLPNLRFNPRIHVSVPYMEYPNEMIFQKRNKVDAPFYLASWRGNTKSNSFRLKMVNLLQSTHSFHIETTDSWLNHQVDEKEAYISLILNAKFSLCPAGWAPVSFRIYESMALGRCPVILADDFVPPVGPNWRDFAMFFPQKLIKDLPAYLLQHEQLYDKLGKQAFVAWKKYFSPEVVSKYVAQTLVYLINSAPVSCKEDELRRWKSLRLYWNNNWTLPQRIINKARRLSRAV